MQLIVAGFMDQNDRVPELAPRGERVARWVDDYIALNRVSLGELAFRIRADKRDLRRLIAERSCGHRLEDALAAYFGWDFVEKVMTPAIGADPIASLEREIEHERASIAARETRLARLKGADRARGSVDGGRLRLVSPQARTFQP